MDHLQVDADRNRIMKKVMADPRLTRLMDPKKMPFDMAGMGRGGFKVPSGQ